MDGFNIDLESQSIAVYLYLFYYGEIHVIICNKFKRNYTFQKMP